MVEGGVVRQTVQLLCVFFWFLFFFMTKKRWGGECAASVSAAGGGATVLLKSRPPGGGVLTLACVRVDVMSPPRVALLCVYSSSFSQRRGGVCTPIAPLDTPSNTREMRVKK